jgi:4a-hydroxytetrahydrobiopterin dehydratase
LTGLAPALGHSGKEPRPAVAEPASTPARLAARHCAACEGGVPPLARHEIEGHLAELGDGWSVVDDHHLEREWRFRDFREALSFTNAVGELAEAEGHHPEILLGWGRVRVDLWTHAAGGLTLNDFVLAAKLSELHR